MQHTVCAVLLVVAITAMPAGQAAADGEIAGRTTDNLFADSAPGQNPASKSPNGSICLAPVKDDGDSRGHFSDDFRVRVDGGQWHKVPSAVPTLIADLSLTGKHLVAIRDGNKAIESFRFQFGAFDSRSLCLWYNAWYQTWSLWDAATGGRKCRCSSSSGALDQAQMSAPHPGRKTLRFTQ